MIFFVILEPQIISNVGSNNTNQIIEDEGMECWLAVGYSPQQNDVSERKNQIVMELSKTMSFEKILRRSFLLHLCIQ